MRPPTTSVPVAKMLRMDAGEARALAQHWTQLLSRRWEIYAGQRSGPMSVQEAIGTALERQLVVGVPDGEGFVFAAPEVAALVAVLTDDAVYVTCPTPLDAEQLAVSFITQRFALQCCRGAALAVEYGIRASGGDLECWTFEFDAGHLSIDSYGFERDRVFPRRLAERIGWPVPERDN